MSSGKSRDGVTRVEEHGLPVDLVEDVDLASAILLGDGETVKVDPVTDKLLEHAVYYVSRQYLPGVAIGRLRSRDDRTLLKRAGELLLINTSKDDGTAVVFDAAHVEREGSAVDELLGVQVVENVWVRAVPAVQGGTGSEDTDAVELGIIGDTKDLLVDLVSYEKYEVSSLYISLLPGMVDSMTYIQP